MTKRRKYVWPVQKGNDCIYDRFDRNNKGIKSMMMDILAEIFKEQGILVDICKCCGIIGLEREFISYGLVKEQYIGICKNCE